MEGDAKAFDRTRDSQEARRPRAVVITTGCPCAAKRAATIVVRTDEHRVIGIPR
jgi:hypothetical protein